MTESHMNGAKNLTFVSYSKLPILFRIQNQATNGLINNPDHTRYTFIKLKNCYF